MLPTKYTPEAARAGITKEQVDAANERQAQAELAGVQVELARIPALRARAIEMMAVFKTGPEYAALHNALADLDGAQSPALQVAALRALDRAIQQWAQSYTIASNMERWAAPARAADAQRQAAEMARPKPLTIEERVKRIEQHLGIE